MSRAARNRRQCAGERRRAAAARLSERGRGGTRSPRRVAARSRGDAAAGRLAADPDGRRARHSARLRGPDQAAFGPCREGRRHRPQRAGHRRLPIIAAKSASFSSIMGRRRSRSSAARASRRLCSRRVVRAALLATPDLDATERGADGFGSTGHLTKQRKRRDDGAFAPRSSGGGGRRRHRNARPPASRRGEGARRPPRTAAAPPRDPAAGAGARAYSQRTARPARRLRTGPRAAQDHGGRHFAGGSERNRMRPARRRPI